MVTEARQPSKTITYREETSGKLEKVIATLKAKDSERYTKLALKMSRVEKLAKEIDEIKAEIKQETREYVIDLFDADDATKTRVIETASVVLTLTKDPKKTESPQYAKILGELENHLTPDLLKMLQELKRQYVTVVQKQPSLTYDGIMPESVVSDVWNRLSLSARKMIRDVKTFVRGLLFDLEEYDNRLDEVKRMLND